MTTVIPMTSRGIAALVMALLAAGTLVSVVTTSDPGWWRLHFSELGTFRTFSSYTFNTTLILTGLLITAFALRVRADLRIRHRIRHRRSSALLVGLITSVGIHLSLVGLIPITANTFLHDRAASGVMLSFLGILALTMLRQRHAPRALRWATTGVTAGLGAAIAGFVVKGINLAALELVGFLLIFAWIGVFTHCLHHKGSLRKLASPSDGDPSAPPPTSSRPARAAAAPMRPPARGRTTPRHPSRATPDARAHLPRGCTESAAPAGSAQWMTRARRSPRSPAAAR